MKKPISLDKPAIIEAIAEVKFKSTAPSAVIFSSLYQDLAELMPQIETLPIQQIPTDFAESQPELKYAAHYRMKGEIFSVGIGSRVISVNYTCLNSSYESWTRFREIIDKVVGSFINAKLAQNIESLSVRYVNLFDKELSPSRLFNISVDIAEAKVDDYDDLNIMISKSVDNSVEVKLQVGTGATVNSPEANLEGTVLNIEAVKKGDSREIMSDLDYLHERVDHEFFSTVTEEVIEKCGPTYE